MAVDQKLNACADAPLHGWRVIPHTSPWREGERWEVYGPNGGGSVNAGDIKDTIVRELLDALADRSREGIAAGSTLDQLAQFTAGDMADQGAKQFREGVAAGTALDQLARQIAENTVRSDIESYAEWVEVDGLQFMDTTKAQEGSGYSVKALEYVRLAVEYIDQRGDAFDWHMQRHISAPHLVRFVDKAEASA